MGRYNNVSAIFFSAYIYRINLQMKVNLRDYQLKDIQSIRDKFRQGHKSVLYVAPTGSGKTVIFSSITQSAAEKDNSVMITVHRKELLNQCSDALEDLGIEHGIIAPGFSMTNNQIQVASVQTLVRRLHKVPEPNLIIYDEAHHRVAGSWDKIGKAYPNARSLGVTATPLRLDGKGLGNNFSAMVIGPSVETLTAQGYLSKAIIYAPPKSIDMSGLRTKFGDFEKNSVASLMDKPTITGDVVEHYLSICAGSPAIAFCASVRHAENLAEQFRKKGIKSESIDGKTNNQDRKRRINSLGDGRIDVLTSCEIVSEGTDIPVVRTAILLRPTKSLALYLQQVGRCLRPYPGKENSIILDHVGNVFRHGFPDEHREWTLDSSKIKNGEYEAPYRQCLKCYAVIAIWHKTCPHCGFVQVIIEREIEQVDGKLEEIDEQEKQMYIISRKREVSKAQTLEELQIVGRNRGYQDGWAFHIFNARLKRRQL